MILFLLSMAAAAPRCRCPELALDRYFAQAEIVVIGRVRSLRSVPGTPAAPQRNEVVIQPVFRPGPFKGSMSGVVFATPIGSASCGVDLAVDRVYIIFATRDAPDNSNLAWFDTCSGSRLYAGGPDVHLMSPFPDIPANRVVTRLAELAEDPPALAQQPVPQPDFHTSPACWDGPRTYHQGTPSKELRDRIKITRDLTPLRESGGVRSPNGAYRAWLPPPSPATTGGGSAFVLIDDERPTPFRVQISGAISPPAVQWINEKLLFMRIAWGRVQFTDLILDAELGRPIYEEAARYGTDAYSQYHTGCLGQCPCLSVPGSADSLAAPPRRRPLPGEQEGLGLLQPDNLAYLDQDWDGRVFSEAGGRRFTVSRLKGAIGREEYPIKVNEIRDVGGTYWLDVSLYRISPCSDPSAVVVHRGWVPAFSGGGRLVAGTWPGGC